MKFNKGFLRLLTMLALALGMAVGQQELPDGPKPQNIPDAPSVTRPPQSPPPMPRASTPPQSPPGSPEPQPEAATSASAQALGPRNTAPGDSRDDLFTLTKNVNFVIVPVTVKDQSGRLVEGLLPNDFTVLEDGVPQPLKLFTSDPFPLSAAIVIDLGMPDITVQKVNKTLSALGGAFAQFDELAIYTYDNIVHHALSFVPAQSERTAKTLRRLRKERGRAGGVPVTGGPLHTPVPTINGRAADPAQQPVMNAPTQAADESRVMNDAILAAAQALARRDRARRKVIFVISDGRESGSTASYSDVMRVLLSNEISVYAVAVGGAAIPGYGTLQKLHIPGLGYGNILPKYASATGGEVFSEFSERAMEEAYSRITQDARNQYTLGYATRPTPSSTYRAIEVRVHRPDVKVFAKDGYYPLPASPR
jgi:VWFA-related protein